MTQALAAPPQEITGPKFQIITKELSGGLGEDGRRRFRATASSTIEDLSGDEIQLPALEQMAQKFRQGITIFMDHKFREVDKAFGLTDGAEIVQRGVNAKGMPIWDLDITGVVNTPNPRAVQLADSIDGKFVKLGTSVTAFVNKHQRHPNGRGMLISGLDVIEASIVGVPDNQRSWAKSAAIAIKGFGHTIADQEDDSVDENETTVAATDAETPDDAGAEPAGAVTETAEKTPTTGDAPVETAPEAADAAADGDDVQESAKESATGPADAETPAGESPDDAGAVDADPPVVEKAYEPSEVKELVGHVTRLVARIGDLEAQIIEKDAKIADYMTQAGAIATEVDTATRVIEKVLAQPLRSRTAGYVEELGGSVFASISPEIAEYLTKRSKLT